MFTVYRIYFNPYFLLLGCNTRLHGVPSAWVFVSGMLAEAKVSPSFLKTPLISRDRVPSYWGCCLLFWDPRVSAFRGPRTSGSYWGLLLPVQGPRAFGFRGPCCLRLGFSYLQPKSFIAPTQILMYSYINSQSSKTVEHCYSYSYSLLSNCCITITTTLHIFT